MKCVYCHKREIERSGRGYKLLLCPQCNLALDIAGSEEGRQVQLNRAMMVALDYFQRWREHPDQCEEPPWARELLRLRETAEQTERELEEARKARERRERRREKDRERNRSYYLAHREQVIARTGKYQREHREECNEYQRKWAKGHPRQRDLDKMRIWWRERGRALREARMANKRLANAGVGVQEDEK